MASLGVLQDPVQDKFPEESMHGALRRNRIGGQNTARPASRSSQAGTRGRGIKADPAYEPYNNHSPSQVSLPDICLTVFSNLCD